MLDIALLRVIKYKEQFDKVYRYIPRSALDKRTQALALCVHKYFELHPEETKVNLHVFTSLLFNKWHKGMDEDSKEFYNTIIGKMHKDASPAVTKSIVNQLLELEFATEVGNLINQYQQGSDIDVVPQVSLLCEAIRSTLERTKNFEFALLSEDLIDEDVNNVGLKWALKCLNDVMRPLRGGDMVIVAARPDAGKTTFLTQSVTFMAGQTDLPILWLNNESKKERILKRSLQSALGATNSELVQKQQAGTMLDEYLSIVGSADAIRVYDIHGWNTQMVEELIESVGEVACVVFDMLDNVKFTGGRADDRTDQILEQKYQWGRELSVKIDAPIIATSQVSTEGSGVQFPAQHMLKDSKTGKQGACDVILMIGKSDDPQLCHQRFLSVPKNKLKIEGQPELLQEVIFDRDRGRYNE